MIQETVWVIMDKNRKVIAKGVPRNRYLIMADDEKDKKRVLTYSSKGRAEANSTGFYDGIGVARYFIDTYGNGDPDWQDYYSLYEYLEAVEMKMTLEEVVS
jgi:hypothetical protein